MASLSVRSLSGIPEIRPGDDLASLILAAMDGEPLRDGQLVVIAHTAVSKAEGALVSLSDVVAGERALELASGDGDTGAARDPRVLQVVLDESAEVLRASRGVLICRTHHGFVCANAGVDASNASAEAGVDTLILLPRDPDASARRIRARLRELTSASAGAVTAGETRQHASSGGPHAPAVLITDSFGRAWRHGQVDVAIGLAGMPALDDWRGRTDASGMELKATWLAIADAAAGAADLARAKDSREPVVIIDGLQRFIGEHDGPGASALLRPLQEDLFR